MREIGYLKQELERLNNWNIGAYSSFSDVSNKMLAVAELNLKLAELLLNIIKAELCK